MMGPRLFVLCRLFEYLVKDVVLYQEDCPISEFRVPLFLM